MSTATTPREMLDAYATRSIVEPTPPSGSVLRTHNWRAVFELPAGTYHLDQPVLGQVVIVKASGNVTIQYNNVTKGSLTSGQVTMFDSDGTNWLGVSTAASGITVTDSNNYTAQTTAEAWLGELAKNQRYIEIDLMSGMLGSGARLGAFADNASPNPGTTLANSKAVGIRWNNNGTQDAPVWFVVPLPYEGFAQVSSGFVPTINIQASKVGATVGDATTFTCAAYLLTNGLLHDASGNMVSGVSTAMTGNAATKTVQQVTATMSDIAYGGKAMSLSVTPTSGTLGTDDVIVHRIWLTY